MCIEKFVLLLSRIFYLGANGPPKPSNIGRMTKQAVNTRSHKMVVRMFCTLHVVVEADASCHHADLPKCLTS